MKILKRPAVSDLTAKPRATLYKEIRLGLFVRPVRLGPRSVGWFLHEIEEMLKARLAGKSDDDIRVLVDELHAARETAN